jgi:hypothetical protein
MGIANIAHRATLVFLMCSIFCVHVRAGDIKGKVTKADSGAPISGANITTKEGKPSTVSKADGSYVLSKIAAGVYTVIATEPRHYPSARQNVQPGPKPVDFQLLERKYNREAKTGKIRADISVDKARELLPAAREANDTIAVFLLANRVASEDASFATEAAKAESDLRTNPAIVAGRVTDKSGAHVSNAKVTLLNRETGLTVATYTNDRGQYSASVFPLGSYSVEAEKSGFVKAAQPEKVEVAPSVNVKADIMLLSGGRL